MQRFQDLMVWQRAHQLVLTIYQTTHHFPPEERYELVRQIRRAAVSIPANIVEGHKRRSKREFANFISIAEGSLEELKYYLQLSKDLGFITENLAEPLYQRAEEIGRMLSGLKSHVKRELSHHALASLR